MLLKAIGNFLSFLDKCKRDKINAYAAQSAFFIILSVIPFLMVFSSLLQYTGITESMLLNVITKLMPEYVSPLLIILIDDVYNRSIGIISITAIIAIWSAAKGIQYIADGLNSVNGLEESRNWLILRFWAVIYTMIFLFAIIFTLLVLVFGNAIHSLAIQYIPFLENVNVYLSKLKGIIMLALLMVFFDIIFATLPNKKLTLVSQLPGAVICSLSWYGFSFGLSIYVDFFHGFSIYGSLTTIAFIMLWLYFCMYIMLMSAEVNVLFSDYLQKFILRMKNKRITKSKNT